MSQNPLVLVADDEPAMNELVARYLRAMDKPKLEVLQARDGGEAWHLARKHLPDLVILDVMMPEMSGWEVCKKIREDVAFAHTGVIMLTGIGQTLNAITSPLYEADAYIDKPFEPHELHEKVRYALKLRTAAREAVDRPSTNGVSAAATFAASDEAPAKAKKTAKKKAAPKKAAPKKAAPNKSGKVAAKKVAAKKAAPKLAKKAASKKATPKKTAKKLAPKKAAAKKPSKKLAPKKPAAKKLAPKKAAPKKPAAKKPAKKIARKR